jgi:alpha-tubulin suppressor-like RCC1 family protein
MLAFLGLSNISKAQLISAGGSHSMFLCSTKQPMVTGDNSYGQIGDGTTIQRNAPVPVTSVSGIIAVSAGLSHSLFLKDDGTVWACGKNTFGELGNGTTTSFSANPVIAQVSSLSGIVAISAGEQHSLFLKNDGTVWACGSNAQGQLGQGNYTNATVPVQVTVVSGVTAISAGHMHSLFLKSDGTVWACGNNANGQLGEGMTSLEKTSPVQVSGLSGVTAISGGTYHSLFLKNDGTAWACGSNIGGHLSDGTTSQRTTPVQCSGITGTVKGISAGNQNSLFLKSDGSAWLGASTPVQIPGLSGITMLSAGGGGANAHSVFLKNDGTVYSMGINYTGQLGDGTTTNRTVPVAVTALCNVASIDEDSSINDNVSVYPNPVNDLFFVSLSEFRNVRAELYDITGQMIRSFILQSETTTVKTEDLAKGIYLLKLSGENGNSVKRLIKN